MRYVSLQQLTQAIPTATLIMLSNDDSYADVINDSVVEQVVTMAEDKVDAYLQSRYTLPLVYVHSLVSEIVVRLARYNLYSRRPEGALPDAVKEAYKDAMRELEAIRDGKILLGISTDSTGETLADSQADFVGEPRRGFAWL
jgi:phage gp36-like protein